MRSAVAQHPSDRPQEAATRGLARLVFGPLLFQAAVVLRRRGVLGHLVKDAARGLTLPELEERTGLTPYGLTVLLDAAHAADLVHMQAGRFYPTRAGIILERDELTQTNMNFVADVCYAAARHLDTAILEGTPAGLHELGQFSDVYQGLSELPEEPQRSWLKFDHFYSDAVFPQMVEQVKELGPASLLDVGGNTGKFSALVCQAAPEVDVTLADLPGQLELARGYLGDLGIAHRVRLEPINVLDANSELPGKHGLVWMSQFLCCFSEPEVVHILKQARRALLPLGELWILDTFVDEQSTDAARIALEATSLYFTCVANGKGRMYHFSAFEKCLKLGGFTVQEKVTPIGFSHTWLRCRPQDP
jgi:ubiquinone/menaquinone biosynthesis C-methylase UbiE